MIPFQVCVTCPDRTGLIAAITGRLFELGGNLGDTAFRLHGADADADFLSLCDLPEDVKAEDIALALRDLPELQGAKIDVQRQNRAAAAGAGGAITHHITVSGGDRPGLIARLTEAFGQYRANIVRMDAQRIRGANGVGIYVTRFAVSIPDRSSEACLNTIANTAGELNLSCDIQAA